MEESIQCNSCNAEFDILVTSPGDFGFEIDFCPICGEELEYESDEDPDEDE